MTGRYITVAVCRDLLAEASAAAPLVPRTRIVAEALRQWIARQQPAAIARAPVPDAADL